MTFGLAGAHRVGKTTLAEAYAKKHGWKFAQTKVTDYIRETGHEPNEKFDFKTRLDIQEHVLIRLDAFYREHEGNSVITDRTPLDVMAYTLAEAVGNSVPEDQEERLKKYMTRGFEVMNKRFGTLLIVQPGIPVVPAEGKAALSMAYMEHLNTLMIGLASDERMKVPHYYIPRGYTDMDYRLNCVDIALKKSMERLLILRAGVERGDMH